MTYRQAGVDIAAGDALVDRIKPLARSTDRPGTMGGLGGFGALFDLRAAGFTDPVLVSTTDGVGTKLKVAIEAGRHGTVGIDLVAMCVNDLVVAGAEPLLFLDYFATGALEVEHAASVVAGIAEGCRIAGCALVGGETAEMPGLYGAGDYDLAGFAVGAAERGQLLPRDVQPGDAVLALPSSGVHSNGFSLVRRLVAASGLGWDAPAPFAPERSLGEALLEPTRIYVRPLLALHRAGLLLAAAHITGGGLPGNLPRVLPAGTVAALDAGTLAPAAGVPLARRARPGRAGGDAARVQLRGRHGAGRARRRGGDRAAGRARRSRPPDRAHRGRRRPGPNRDRRPRPLARLSRIAILFSGRGSNMEALLEAASAADFPGRVVLALCNVEDAPGLRLAESRGVETRCIPHRRFGPDREAHEREVHRALEAAGVETVCLAGYMRRLTPFLVGAWAGRMLNIHPSLLPAFPGLHTHRRALEAGVKLHGCTVHLVTEEVDAGPILAQAAIPVLPDDDEDRLAARVLRQEHVLYPAALRRHLGAPGPAANADAALLNPLPAPDTARR